MSHEMAPSSGTSPVSSSHFSPSLPTGSRVPPRSGSPVRWRFGDLELDPVASRLTRAGEPVAIQTQPLKLLTLLVVEAVAAPGRVVSREAIRDHLWQDTHVDYDQGINFAIRQVRRALGEDASAPRLVETVPGEGYRFLGEVEEVSRRTEEPGGEPRAPGCSGGARPPRWLGRRAVPALVGAVVALVGLASVLGMLLGWTAGGAVRGGSSPLSIGASARPGSAAPPRILVLPFRQREPAVEDRGLGELLAEEVITGLGRRLRGKLDPLAIETVRRLGEARFEIEDLHPDYLVEGSIRRTGVGFRVLARLTDARDRSQLWATAYERPGPADLPELGRTLADAVALHFTGERGGTASGGPRARDPEVFRLYRRAKEKLEDSLVIYNRKAEAEVYEAHRLLEKALELDPTYPPLHVELARIHIWRSPAAAGVPPDATAQAADRNRPWIPNEGRARRHVRMALMLDEQSEAAHALRGALALYRDVDLETAKASLERALELNPSYALAQSLLGTVLLVSGHQDEAAVALHRSLALNPLDFKLHVAAGRRFFVMRRFDEARRVFARAEELLPPPPECLTCLRLSLRMEVASGNLERAVALGAREVRRMGELGQTVPVLDAASPAENLARFWRWRLERLAPDDFFVDRAALLLALGEPDEALAALERALSTRQDPARLFIPWDPRFDGLRDDPRFRHIVTRLLDGIEPPEAPPMRLASR